MNALTSYSITMCVLQDNGLSELLSVYEGKTGIRQFLATIVLLGYHLFLTTFMGNRDVDLRLCKKILDEKVQQYPEGLFFRFFKGRFHLIQVYEKLRFRHK